MKSRIVLVLPAMMLALSSARAQPTTATPDRNNPSEAEWQARLHDCVALLLSEKNREAIETCLDSIIAHYEHAYADTATVYYCARTSEESLLYLMQSATTDTRAVVLGETWADAYYYKAYALIELGDIRGATVCLNRANRLSPSNSRYMNEMGHLCTLVRNWDESLKWFRSGAEAAALAPEDQRTPEMTRAWRGVGYVFIELHRLDEAVEMFQKCLEVNPNDRSAISELEYIEGLRAREEK